MGLERDKYRFAPFRYSFQSGVGTGRRRDLFPDDLCPQIISLYDFPRTDEFDEELYYETSIEDTEYLPNYGSQECPMLRFW